MTFVLSMHFSSSPWSLIDLAGFEKATFDKERTREGKYINTSLLTLCAVIGTLSDSASKRKKTSKYAVNGRILGSLLIALQCHDQKEEVIDIEALIQPYMKEIEELGTSR
ncbi:hypothetical protein AGABI2DRAFT_144363 [Agaricus bisporus var. bisporus H97]|uniref:hypothetical protein n=1 Tax=Agaricus bisporus var. bisporus (strain H97 / ATCC MYA-4626 / FGSC 10389) TaxID=936046 RepID=UPI00029F51BD|nr:hypothetical protein AGABI2DRAFT_144363 [Agaricus bisporus var. bisporus H97]EKV46099.1 hypothetical protein AGABI2DRAFT_144363 [Agaricus bisporus var. bisporus H97]